MAKVMVAMYCFDYPDDYFEYDEYDDGETGFVSDSKFLNASLLCDKFRVLDLDTLIIDDYSFRDVVEIRDEIVNLHLGEVSKESLDSGYECFNLVGCTQSFIDSEFGYDKTGNLDVPDNCNFMPIVYKGKIIDEERVFRVDCCDEPISLLSDTIIPNTFKKVILDGSDLSEYSANKGKSYNIVIPPSVYNLAIKNETPYKALYGDKSTLENIKLTFHIPSKRKDLVYEIYMQLSDTIIDSSLKVIRSKFTEDGYKDIMNFIVDECKVGIELY